VKTDYDVIVLGGGPAGLTAGIYLGRARVDSLILDTGTVGGQTVLSYSVANYPGVEETSGYALSATMLRQARSFGATVKPYAKIQSVQLEGDRKIVTLADGTRLTSRALIVATGGVPRKLGISNEEEFTGKGVSFCATCDGDFFTDRPIAVVGGGNSALEEAQALAKYASRVTVLHEFDHFQAHPWVVEEAQANPKLHFLMSQQVLRFEGSEKLERVVSRHKATGEETSVAVDGCFVFVGYVPNSRVVASLVETSERGEIVTDAALATSVPGVFAAGDVRAKRYRQITTAVADGTIAALSAIDHLTSRAAA